MEVVAKTRYVRLSADKARFLARRLKGMRVDQALMTVELSRTKAGVQIGKTLRSAIANAQNNAKVGAGDLHVKQVFIDAGPAMKRFWARARGSASPILRRMSHIRVIVTDEKTGRK